MMRKATFAILLALGLSAFAQEGDLFSLRVRIPAKHGLREKLSISDSLLEKWQLTQTELANIKDKIAKLNQDREGLFANLLAAQQELLAAQKKANEAVSAIEQQDLEFKNYLARDLGGAKAEDFALRAEIQPAIEWLKLTDDQVTTLLTSLRGVIDKHRVDGKDPREAIIDAGRAAREAARVGEPPADDDERKAQIQRLQAYMAFNKEWIKTIEGALTPEQRTLWDTRYRRALGTIREEGGGLP